ncbi:MAG: MaoC family dehydratase [Ktedonobacteraceae bacterium]|nr:MaoC family dehydratase [Ktedonobacteraceae bacterium]
MSKHAQTQKLAPLPRVGTQATHIRTVSEADVQSFAHVSGDYNPVHLDHEYAARTPFGGRIAHGLLTGAFISAVLGNDLPGPGSIYVSQTFKFLAPVYLGDTIATTVEVVAVREEKRLVTLRTTCTNQNGTTVLTGEATIKYMKVLEEN